MANTIVDTSLVARDASVILQDNLVATRLTNRSYEDRFATKVGDTVKIKVPPIFSTTRDLLVDLTTTADTITDTYAELKLDRQFYRRIDLTTLDATVNLEDFNQWITFPVVRAIADDIDSQTIDRAVQGFAQNTNGLVGSAGGRPSTLAHIAAGAKALNDDGCPLDYRIGVVDTTAHSSFIQLAEFKSLDYGSQKASTLEDSLLGKLMTISWFMDQNAGTQSRGTTAGVAAFTNVYGGSQAGSTLNVDNGGATSTGTIYQGARFTIAGLTKTYVAKNDVTASSGYFAVPLNIALESAPADNAAITLVAACTENYIYDRRALGAAVVAPAALSVNSASAIYDGIGMRVTRDISTSSMSDTIVFDTLSAVKVIQANAGRVLQS
jgi:hypothetical protein